MLQGGRGGGARYGRHGNPVIVVAITTIIIVIIIIIIITRRNPSSAQRKTQGQARGQHQE